MSSLEEWSAAFYVTRSMADDLERATGRRVGTGPFISDLAKALKQADEVIHAQLNTCLYPEGREIAFSEFERRFGL